MSEKKQVSIQEIAVSNMISIEALVRILVKRGFINHEDNIMSIYSKKGNDVTLAKYYDFSPYF